MKKLFNIIVLVVAICTFASPAIADTPAPLNCPTGQHQEVATYASDGVSPASYACVNNYANSTNPCITIGGGVDPSCNSNGKAAAPSTNTGCPNGGQIVNGVCNLGYTPLEPIPGVTDNSKLTTAGGFADLVNAIFKIMITGGALLAVLMLTIGGIQYMVATAIPNKKQGLERAKAAIYGLLLLAAIYLILNTINPHLLDFNFVACKGSGCGSAAAVTPGSTSGGSGASTNSNATVNGGGTALGSVATVGTINAAQIKAANAALGLDPGLNGGRGVASLQTLVYDPSNLSSTNSAAINAFTSECQASFFSNLTGGFIQTHNVAIVPGSVVGASGESALVCVSN